MRDFNFGLRESRDTLIDLLPIKSTFPLRNLPVNPERPKVSYNDSTHIIISWSQPDVLYSIIDDTGHIFQEPVPGNSGDLSIPTDLLTKEDYTFSVLATKQNSGLENVLLQTVTIQVGVDTGLIVRLIDEIIDFNATATIVVEATQRNAKYQAFDLKGNPISEEVLSGEGGDLLITTQTQPEDQGIKVKATNLKTGLNDWMRQQVKVFVKPNLNLEVSLEQEVIDYKAKGTVVIKNSQKSTQYLLRFEWIDDDTVDQNEINNTTAVAVKKGNDDVLKITTGILIEDIRLNVLATKIDSNIEAQLLQTITIPVRPDPSRKLSKVDETVDFSQGTFIRVNDSQPGIQYQLRNDVNNAKIGWPRYHSRNKGIDIGRIEMDFAIDEFAGNSVDLPTGGLTKTKTLNVLAIKTTTKVTAELKDTITIEVPASDQ